MRDRWGPLHLVVPDEQAGKYDDRDVIVSYDRCYSLIDLAKKLWRLIGAEAEAQRIQAVMSRAYEREVPTLDQDGIAQLLGPIERIPAALRHDFPLDDHDHLTMAQVEDLRKRVDWLDLEESRGGAVIHALEEAIGDIVGLGSILRRAQKEGAHIIFD